MFIHFHKIATFEKASQLAQDIKTSLRFSSKRRVIPKVEEQASPNTRAIRDPKNKFVIGESSKNAKGSQSLSVKVTITLLRSVPLGTF